MRYLLITFQLFIAIACIGQDQTNDVIYLKSGDSIVGIDMAKRKDGSVVIKFGGAWHAYYPEQILGTRSKPVDPITSIPQSSNIVLADYEDVVYLNNGSIIHGLIIETVPNVSVKIKTATNDVFSYKMSEIQKIAKEVPSNKIQSVSPQITSAHSDQMYHQGEIDALDKFRSGGVFPGTFFTTILAGPLFGLIPACVCSRSNLPYNGYRFADKRYIDNADYKEGFRSEAVHKKRANAWAAWGTGFALDLIVGVTVGVLKSRK